MVNNSRQIVIDFSQVFPEKRAGRGRGIPKRRVPMDERVPVQEVEALQEVRIRCRLTYSEIARRMGEADPHGGLSYRVLGQGQPVNREDFERIFHATAELIMERIRNA